MADDVAEAPPKRVPLTLPDNAEKPPEAPQPKPEPVPTADPNLRDIAQLWVNDKVFEDWESVWVQVQYLASFSYFRFTAAERDPIFFKPGLPNYFPLSSQLQFKPGDKCKIKLAGQQVIEGLIYARSVAYDANQHGVMLIGKSNTAAAAASSVETKTGNFDGKTIKQIADECTAPYGCKVLTIGKIDLTPFKHLQNEPGELVWDFLERIARFRNVIMGSDTKGNFLLIGKHSTPIVKELIEGQNILSCNCTISIEEDRLNYDVHGQKHGEGTESTEQTAHAKSDIPNVPKSKIITPYELESGTQQELQNRADYEKLWRQGEHIGATIVVQGWLRDGKSLWQAGDQVFVRSPMAMLNQELKVVSATFTQDSRGGSLTTLDLKDPESVFGTKNFNVTKTSA